MKQKLFQIATFFACSMAIAQHKLPELPYAYSQLEPHIDKQTMLIHHTKHHQAYVDNLNKEALTYPDVANKTVEDICRTVNKFSVAVRNNAGGHFNHSLFWKMLTPEKKQPGKKTMELIERDFESLELFKKEFNKAARTKFGSGWAWVVLDNNKKLAITSTSNQDNPIMPIAELQGEPILALDVWEHAYYLKYQNKRTDYIDAFWNIINWDYVEELLEKSLKK